MPKSTVARASGRSVPRIPGLRQDLKALLPVRLRRLLRRARLSVWSMADRVGSGRVAPGYGGLIGEGDFDEVGREFLGHFRELGALEPTDRVLDIGCGLGRMAGPLTTFLSGGSYHGFDVVRPTIESCRRRFAAYPAFHFDHVDVYNGKYNPQGKVPPSAFRFPYADGAFDLAFAASVFTHMLPEDIERYLRETARVLTTGGRLLATWFVMTPEAARRVAEHASDVDFPVRDDDVWMSDSREAEAAIAFSPVALQALYDASGLEIEGPIRHGRWSGAADGLSYQDIVVARRRES
jgi:SAM-dependent methyltransferase